MSDPQADEAFRRSVCTQPPGRGRVRAEADSLGEREVPLEAYWGINVSRALENFAISGRPISVYSDLIYAYACVKQAAALANGELGVLERWKADLIARACSPATLWKDLEQRHGSPEMLVEHFGMQDAAGLEQLRNRLLRATDQLAAIAVELLGEHRLDLACIVFGAVHRGGHYLWDLSQIDATGLDAAAQDRIAGALVEILQRIDQSIGRILEVIDPQATVIVFALHGMERNHGMAD